MPYCPRCGVELAPETDTCPLCSFDMRRISGESCPEPRIPPVSGMQEVLGSRNKPTNLWEVFSVAVLIAATVVAGVNVLDSGSFSWSMYPLFSLAFLWILVTTGLVAGKHLPAAVTVAALSLPVYLVSLDAIDGSLSWAFPIAIPIALVSELAVTGAVVASLRTKRMGTNVIGFILIAAAVICLGIEMTLDIQAHGEISLHWSAITSLTLIPIAAFLLYLHHRVVKEANLHKLLRF